MRATLTLLALAVFWTSPAFAVTRWQACMETPSCKREADAYVAAATATLQAQIAALQAQLEEGTPASDVTVAPPLGVHAPIGQPLDVTLTTPATGSVLFLLPVRSADGTIPAGAGWIVTNTATEPGKVTLNVTADTTTPVTAYLRVQAPGTSPIDYPIVMTGDGTTPIPGTWTRCAAEYQVCAFTGTKQVRYGKDGGPWVEKTLTGGTPCTNAVFGDPAPGAWKFCDVR